MSISQIYCNKDNKISRLDKFLCFKFDISFAVAVKIIRLNRVLVNEAKVNFDYKLHNGDKIEIFTNLKLRNIAKNNKIISKELLAKFHSWIIYENDNMLAIDKPSGIACQGGSGIKISIDDFLKNKSWQLVHRLDKDTSGVLLIAKNSKYAQFLVECFKARKVNKTYIAVVKGVVKKDEGKIIIPLSKKEINKNEKVFPDYENGKTAITKYEIVKRYKEYTKIKLFPVTGRTHQLRVHMKEIGHPIINDIKYGGKFVENKNLGDRLCLHACEVNVDNIIIKSPTNKHT